MECIIIIPLPSPTVVDCGDPPSLENATIRSQSGTTFGSNVTYICNEDESIKQRTCLTSGKWSNIGIKCGKFKHNT